MEIQIVIKNYRCFSDAKPAYLYFKPGLTSIIGTNNSGKTTILKFIYEFRQMFASFKDGQGILTGLSSNGMVFQFPETIKSSEDIFCNSNNRDIEIIISCYEEYSGELSEIRPYPAKLIISIKRLENRARIVIVHQNGEILTYRTSLTANSGSIIKNDEVLAKVEVFSRAFRILSEAVYIGAFRNVVNIGGLSNYYDIEIGEEFVRKWSSLKNGNNRKHSQITYKLCDDIKSIFGYKSFDVNSSDDRKSLKIMVNSKVYDISELGAGIAQFILVLVNVAISSPSIILIDEPEMNLHPTLQIDFITSLARYSSFGLIFTTHSVGLARSVSDQIYSTRRLDPDGCELRKFEELKNLVEYLGALSYSSYVDIGSNKILLVEGKHDIKVFQQLLRKLKKDHEVVIIPLMGSVYVNEDVGAQLKEITRLSSNVFTVIDSEKNSEADPISKHRQAYVKMCNDIGIKSLVLNKRAIENYFTDRVVKKVLGESKLALGPYQLLNDGMEFWSKKDNWKLAAELDIEEFKKTEIYEFLCSI